MRKQDRIITDADFPASITTPAPIRTEVPIFAEESITAEAWISDAGTRTW
jgi:hypothetical protein